MNKKQKHYHTMVKTMELRNVVVYTKHDDVVSKHFQLQQASQCNVCGLLEWNKIKIVDEGDYENN